MAPMRRALPAFLLLVLLAGCTGGDPAPSPSATPARDVVATPSEEVTPSEAATPTDDTSSPVPALDLAEFRSESVQCVVRDDGLECQLQVAPTWVVPDEYLKYEVPCLSVFLTSTATEGELACGGDVISGSVSFTDALPVGTVVTHGGLTCTLLEVGAVCTNEVGGEVEITADAYRLTR
ncbi:hypothetical protein ACTHAM_001667 [Cellulomonas soli]|uniref:hypothetical protein n=1 Tax=Cellulomonas soli TaxID=931535 RepID=UPI003F83B238